MSSKDSTIYPGVATAKGALKQLEKLDEDHEIHGPFGGVEHFKGMTCNASTPDISKPEAYKRQLEALVPAGVDASKGSPFMIFLDGLQTEMLGQIAPVFRLARKLCCCCCPGVGDTAADVILWIHTMDNLFKEKQLEPMVCIFLDQGGSQDENCIWGSQRNLEYDVASSTLMDFVEQEVLPFVSEKCGLLLATDPDQRVMGSSSGGNAAIAMVLTGRFNRILTLLLLSIICVPISNAASSPLPLIGYLPHALFRLIENDSTNASSF